jgi:hypothetical protein
MASDCRTELSLRRMPSEFNDLLEPVNYKTHRAFRGLRFSESAKPFEGLEQQG